MKRKKEKKNRDFLLFVFLIKSLFLLYFITFLFNQAKKNKTLKNYLELFYFLPLQTNLSLSQLCKARNTVEHDLDFIGHPHGFRPSVPAPGTSHADFLADMFVLYIFMLSFVNKTYKSSNNRENSNMLKVLFF